MKLSVSSLGKMLRHLALTSSLVALSCTAMAQVSGKFTPTNGRTLLILGQDLNSVQGYSSSGLFPEIGGITQYTNVYDMAGLDNITNYGAGDMGLREAMNRYPNSVLSIGLWMVEDNDGVGQDHPNGLTELINGVYDSSLSRFASFAQDYNPRPIFLRIGYEFDGPWNNYDPTRYRNAFRYIKDYLDNQGVTNVAYVWQSAAWGETGGNIDPWYPGDNYVDWVGLSFFFYDANFNGDELDSLLSFARSRNKPIQMSEVSAQYYEFDQGTFHPFDNPGAGQFLGGSGIWQQFFVDQLLPFVKNNSDVIRQVAYINADWQSQPQWRWPDAGNGFWGDTRIEVDNTIASNWASEISDTQFWLHGGPTLLADLGITGGATPPPTPTPDPSATATPTTAPTALPTATPVPNNCPASHPLFCGGNCYVDEAQAASAGCTVTNPTPIPTPVPTSVPTTAPTATPTPVITPAPSDYEFIVHKPTGSKFQSCSTTDGSPVSAGESSLTDDCVQWERINNGNYFYIQNRASQKYIRPDSSSNGSAIVIRPSSWTGNWTQWSYAGTGDGYGYLVNRATGKHVYVGSANSNLQQQPSSWRGDYTRWRFDPASTSTPTPTSTPTATPTPTPTATSNPGLSGKLVPPDGRTLMIVGQDLLSVSNYDNSSAPTPGGVTTYIAFYDILNDGALNGGLGINSSDQVNTIDIDWGGGPLHAYNAGLGFPNSTLQIGLNIAEGNNGNLWCAGCLAQLANGQRQAEINQLADMFLRIPNVPIYLRIGYEFEGLWNDGYENTDNYVRAYRNIVDGLRARGVNNVAYVWQSSASPIDDIIEGQREDITPWYPGDNYVDWVGLSWFLLPNEQPPVGGFTADQLTLATEMVDFSRARGLPVMIAESTPQGYDIGGGQNCNISPVWDGTAATNCVAKSPNQIWDEWFVPFFGFIHANSDVIKAVSYINANWNAQGLWDSPYEQGYWGDTRVEANSTILNNWNSELGNSNFWINGSSNINNDVGF